MAYIGNSPGVASQRVTSTFTATAGQTTFTPISGYTLGYCDVYYNGVKLVDGDDYTASNGVTVVLTNAAAVGDSVEIVTHFPRGLSDGYTQSEANARYTQRSNNLSDLSSASTARTNLGLGTAATQNTGVFLQTANNLSDVTASTARSNLGIGNVENKSSATIRGEITSGNVTTALGYTPVNRAGDTMTGPLTVTALTSSQVMAPQVSTNGGFINTGVLGSSGYAWEVFGTVNPNSQGSSYVDVIHGYVYIGYGWNGSDLTAYLQWVSIAPPAREVYPSGSGNSGNVIDVVFWNGTSEANTVSAGSLASNQLRIKIPNYNTSGVSSAGFYITRKA